MPRTPQTSSAKAVFDITWPQPLTEPAAPPAARSGDGPSSPLNSPRPGSIQPSDFREVKFKGDWMRRPIGDNEARFFLFVPPPRSTFESQAARCSRAGNAAPAPAALPVRTTSFDD